MGRYKLPRKGTMSPMQRPPSSDQMKAAIEQAKAHIQTQKEVADLLGEKINCRSQQRVAEAVLAMIRINALGRQVLQEDGTDDISSHNSEIREEIEARRALRRANARFAAAEIAHMVYEHEGLLRAIEMAEKQIEAAEHPSPIMQPHGQFGY